jgi:hypothetical protein
MRFFTKMQKLLKLYNFLLKNTLDKFKEMH